MKINKNCPHILRIQNKNSLEDSNTAAAIPWVEVFTTKGSGVCVCVTNIFHSYLTQILFYLRIFLFLLQTRLSIWAYAKCGPMISIEEKTALQYQKWTITRLLKKYVGNSKVVKYLRLKHQIKTLSITHINATFLLKMLAATIVSFNLNCWMFPFFLESSTSIPWLKQDNLPKLSSILISKEWSMRTRTREMCGRTCVVARVRVRAKRAVWSKIFRKL